MQGLIRIELLVPAGNEEAVILFLTQNAAHGWEEESLQGRTLFRVHFEPGPAAEEVIRDLSARFPGLEMARSEVERRNWNEAWQEFFTPIEIGPEMTVVPSWLAGTTGGPEIVIHPAMAFGTGHHASTRLCLKALVALKEAGALKPGGRFLDLGTGSGILAIAAASLGLTGLGLDIDPVAVENAALNVRVNKCADRVITAAGGIETLRPEEAFDLVMANILAGTLKDLAPALGSRVGPGGSLILSGILDTQAPGVAEAYAEEGFAEPGIMREGEWTALVFAPRGAST